MKKKYTARVSVTFSVHYDLAIQTDNSDPSDDEILSKLWGKQIFTDVGNESYGLSEWILTEEGVTVEGSCCDGDPSPTGRRHIRRDWDITIDENEGEQQ